MTPALSVWLDLCRVVAALAVFIGHAVLLGVAPQSVGLIWQRSADDAVTAFFVISGLVIAHTTASSHGQAGGYVLARLSRVYSVALPAVVFALAVDLVGMRWDASQYDPGWQYPKLWLYLPFHWLFLGETWFGAIYPFTMAPYWSLGYEVWYYVLFGCITFLTRRTRWWIVLGVLLLMGPRILLLLPAWWMGVWLYRHLERLRTGPWVAVSLMLCALAGYGLFLASGWRDMTDVVSNQFYGWLSAVLPRPFDAGSTVHVLSDYVVAALFAVFLVGCAGCRFTFAPGVGVVIRWLAGHTFTFYLIHYTLLVFARALGIERAPWPGFAAVLGAVLLVTWLLAQVGEQRRHWYRAAFVQVWDWLSAHMKLVRRP